MRLNRAVPYAAGLSLALLVLGGPLPAQRSPHRKRNCGEIVRITGRPLTAEEFAATFPYGGCGTPDEAKALLDSIPWYAFVSDTVALETFMDRVGTWRDSALLGAVSRVAKDMTATVQARVFAIRYLTLLLNPTVGFLYGDMIRSMVVDTTPDFITYTPPCRIALSPGGQFLLVTPMPGDWRSRVHLTLRALATDTTQAVAIRNAAACMNYIWEQ